MGVQGAAATKGMGNFLDQRAKELADEEEQAMKEIVGDDDFKPSWYSRQQEKVAETMRKLNYGLPIPKAADSQESKENTEPPKKQHVFAPPARGAPAAPPPAPDNELDEMD